MSGHWDSELDGCAFSESFEPFADLIVEQVDAGGEMSISIVLKLGLVALPGALGYLYYALAGCQSGVCPLTSSSYISTGYGALIGAFVGFGILSNRKRDHSEKE